MAINYILSFLIFLVAAAGESKEKEASQQWCNGKTGTVFTVWGRSDCPKTPGTELVYAGIAAKSEWTVKGGGIDYQCLSRQPQSLTLKPGIQQPRSYITAVEFEDWEGGPLSRFNLGDITCAVCFTSSRSTTLMIPGRVQCPAGWTVEYSGYLVAERWFHTNPSNHICLNKNMAIIGIKKNTHGGIAVHVEVKCYHNKNYCPPYTNGNEVTCAVCTR